MLPTTISVTFDSTNNPLQAIRWLSSIPSDIIACDFETASRYTDEQKLAFSNQLSSLPPNSLESHHLKQLISSDGLSHPSLSQVTHFQYAYSESHAFVIILDSPRITDIVLNWLVTTSITQIWHNSSFDFQYIYHHTGKFPLNYEDSQLLAKTLLNNVNNQKAQVGLKYLQGYKYGDWAVSSDSFHLSQMYDPTLLKYCAVDACATYSLWTELQEYIHS